MTQSDANSSTNRQFVLLNILHEIAKDPIEQKVILSILQQLVEFTYASAGLFVLFDEAEILVSVGLLESVTEINQVKSTLQLNMTELYTDVNVPIEWGREFAGRVIIPIIQDDVNVGAVILLYKQGAKNITSLDQQIEAFLDLLKIITHVARLRAQQIRHNRNRQEFLRIVTHDMRSPLTSMHGFGSMLESQMAGELNEKQSHFLSKIMSGIAQLTLQIDNMQDAGRYDPEAGFYEMSRMPTDLIDLVQRLVQLALVPTDKQNLKLDFWADDTLPIVNVDSAMIERSVVNLIDNAIKYTPDSGNIEVSVQHKDDAILIVVADDGLGINSENIDKLFNRHFRIQRQEHKRIKGSGLGLFIVRSVARKHDGDAWVESVEGEGSKFFIRIPLTGKNLIGGE